MATPLIKTLFTGPKGDWFRRVPLYRIFGQKLAKCYFQVYPYLLFSPCTPAASRIMAQPPNGPAPVPRQRTYSLLPQKKELVDLFSNFTSSAVEQRHEDLARTCISFSPRGKYQYVNLKLLLERNEVGRGMNCPMRVFFFFACLCVIKFLISLVWRHPGRNNLQIKDKLFNTQK